MNGSDIFAGGTTSIATAKEAMHRLLNGFLALVDEKHHDDAHKLSSYAVAHLNHAQRCLAELEGLELYGRRVWPSNHLPKTSLPSPIPFLASEPRKSVKETVDG